MKFNKSSIIAFALAILIFSPGQAYATPESEDQNDLSSEEIAAAIANGYIETEDIEPGTVDCPTPLADNSYVFTTVGGSTRYETSSLQALSAFSSASTVIVAGGETFADSIAGSGLAGALNAPVLLVGPTWLENSTKDALSKLSPNHIIILGGTDVVSASVENQLKGYAPQVTRISGPSRFETQQAIYNYGSQQGLWTGDTAIVSTAMSFADALSVSPVAYALKAPIVFVDSSGNLPSSQFESIRQSGKSHFLILGGTDVVTSNVESLLNGIGSTKRLGGTTRYETSRAINDYAVANYGFNWDGVAFSSGQKPWDSLGGGAMQGSKRKLLALLDNTGPKSSVSAPVSGKPSSMIYLGGRDVYPNSFKAQIAYSMGYPVTEIQGFRVYIDAGHGFESSGPGTGFDPGAIGSGYREVDLAQELSDKVASVLRNQYGLDVYVNKSGWYKLRQAQASMLDCGVLVSIHFNAGGGTGTESYVHSHNAATGSTRLQASVHNKMVSAIGLTNRGTKNMQLAVLSGKVPATLLEVAYIDRASDISTYRSRIDAAASGIADGIANA